MSQVEKQRTRLISLLKELFQLDQPDLDFGFYRIMHAKAGQVSKFLEEDLLGIIKVLFKNFLVIFKDLNALFCN